MATTTRHGHIRNTKSGRTNVRTHQMDYIESAERTGLAAGRAGITAGKLLGRGALALGKKTYGWLQRETPEEFTTERTKLIRKLALIKWGQKLLDSQVRNNIISVGRYNDRTKTLANETEKTVKELQAREQYYKQQQ